MLRILKAHFLESELAVLRSGVIIDGVRTAKSSIKKLKYAEGVTRVQLTIHEGRNRQIKKCLKQ